jgi:hypothetical protein
MATTINTVTFTGTNGSAGVAAQPAYATAANGDPGQLATAVGGSGGTFTVNSTGSTAPSAGYVGAAAGAYADLNPSSAYTPPGTALQGTASATGGAGGAETLLVQNGSTQYFAGAGGSATAKVQTSASGISIGGAVTASATAAGGSGGYVYDPSGIHSGNGGNASASGYVFDQQDAPLTISVKAVGGNAGEPSPNTVTTGDGSGGTAQISAGGISRGGAVNVSGTAIGGNGQNGANETLNNVVSGQTTGALTLSQTAVGGNALGAGGTGGNASSTLTQDFTDGSLPQPSSLSLTVNATGGNGGPASGSVAAGNAGTASIGALGTLTGGGAVTISGTAKGGSGTNGANEILNNAVGGQTSGALALSQTAIGGNNAPLRGGAGGYASSSLSDQFGSGSAAQPSSLSLTVTAEAGAGGTATYSSPAGAGGNAAISATGSLSNGGAVTIVGKAAAGSGGPAVTGSAWGAAGQLITAENSLFGSSNGGAVNVSGLFYGGSGQNGANVNLSNVVGGQTTGALTLEQTATAGEALNDGGTAGYASSKLDEQYASTSPQPSSLSLMVKATGGFGGQAASSTAAQAGGNAAVSATGSLTRIFHRCRCRAVCAQALHPVKSRY